MSSEAANEHAKDDKTYVWVKLRDGIFNPDHCPKRGASNVTNKKRGAPMSGATDGDVWGWAPGYYSTINKDGGEEKKDGETEGSYHFSLLGLDSSGGDEDGDGAGVGTSEHTLAEAATAKLLESGDIVLANAWEQHDFTNRLQLGGDDNDDESDYNYDESDSDSDNDDLANTRGVSFLEAPDDCPPTNLIDLTHLHEPSVVHALRRRYESSTEDMTNIYTDTGPILLAINPFKYDDSGLLYGDDTVKKYRVEGEGRWRKERSVKAGDAAEGMDEEEGKKLLSPHVYSVADRTFRTMMTRIHPSADPSASKIKSAAPPPDKNNGPKVNQSVLVSGESGAGKTVTTKLLMAYLSKLSENPAAETGAEGGKPKMAKTSSTRASFSIAKEGMSIEKRVLESNPIMESFGNARTIRNDNSSRFGKYIEMKFVGKTNKGGSDGSSIPGATLVGASIDTYLLEKVRLVHQSPGERNYHIFYELFSMKYDEEEEEEEEETGGQENAVEKLGLLNYDMEDFHLINTSDTYDRRDGVPDAETFGDLKRAMKVMGFTKEQSAAVFEVTSALLHASNLTFERVGEVECALETDNQHLEYVVDLLGITREGLSSALCYYEITIGGTGRKGGETHKRVLSKEQCEKGVEALIKATYGALFSYLVQRINVSIAGDNAGVVGAGGKALKAKRGAAKEASIGILDIFGFESFQTNSFEQLCINYCNEALQQQFNLFVLRNEQEEYDREGIPWSFIEFPENQDVLDLIDFKGTGILNMLHDQCRTPGASDKTFALQMYEKCSKHERFEADSRQVAEQLFGVHHYAGLVEYDVEGFVEKNRDELPKSGSDLLLSSKNDFVKALAQILQPPEPVGKKSMMSPRGGKGQHPTVGIQFSSQLQSLRCKIDDTSPHYIRCLKPNNLLVPDQFDAALIADQLRCAGVIEAVRVSRLGYPQRFSHSQFTARYRVLGKKLKKKKDLSKKYNPAKALVHSIMQRLKDQPDIGIQVGKTKVFLRRQAYDLLEKLRRERITSGAVTIQKIARGYICRKFLQRALSSTLTMQCFVRRILAQRVVNEVRWRHNSIIIQRTWRKFAAKKMFIAAKVISHWCQAHQRGSEGRRIYNELNRERKARYLQSQWRGYVVLKHYRRQIHAILTIQCARRCYVARLGLFELRSVARDFSAVVQERDRLRQEAIELRNELQKAKDGARQVEDMDTNEKDAEIEEKKSEIQEKDAEIQSLREAFKESSKEKEAAVKELQEVNKSIESLKSERDLAVRDHDDLKEVNKMLQKELSSQEEVLREMKEELSEANKSKRYSTVQENQSARVVSTDTSQMFEMKKELQFLKETNESLQDDNNRLTEENSALLSTTEELMQSANETKEESASQSNEMAELEQLGEMCDALKADNARLKNENTTLLSKTEAVDDEKHLKEINADLEEDNARLKNENSALLSRAGAPVSPNEAKIPGDVTKKSDALEKSPATINQSVCTSVTVDMDMSEDEMTKLREENSLLQKQLDLLRANQDFPEISGDYSYEESVVPDSQCSTSGNEISASDVPESVLKQICSEVEMVTEEVIIKTRAECEAKTATLQQEMEDAIAEMEKTKRLAKYDLDDMNRVNRSIRGDLEVLEREKSLLMQDLEEKCEDFEALNEDVERFAETFAEQHDELQHMERRAQKLEAENQLLKESDVNQKKRIEELEARRESKSSPAKNDTSELALNEITKLWQEMARLKTTSVDSGDSSKERRRRRRDRSVNSFDSDISSEDET